MDLKKIRGLLIDIDGTITSFKEGVSPNTGSLMMVLQRAGVELAGLTEEETAARMKKIFRGNNFFHIKL